MNDTYILNPYQIDSRDDVLESVTILDLQNRVLSGPLPR